MNVEYSPLYFKYKVQQTIRYWSVTSYEQFFFFFSSRRRHTRLVSDWSSDVCSSDLASLSSANNPLTVSRSAWRIFALHLSTSTISKGEPAMRELCRRSSPVRLDTDRKSVV